MSKKLSLVAWTLLIYTWSMAISGTDQVENARNYLFSYSVNFSIGALAALIVQLTAAIITYRVSKRNKSEKPYRNVLIVNGFILFCLLVKYFMTPLLF